MQSVNLCITQNKTYYVLQDCSLYGIYTNNNIVAVPTTILIPTDPRIRQFHPFTY